MGHLRVELHTEQGPPIVFECSDRGIHARCRDRVTRRRSIDVIAVAHPDRRLLSQSEPLEQSATFDPHVGPAVLAPIGARHFAAGEMGEELHAVAKAENGGPQLEQRRIGGGDVLPVDRVRAAGEDDPLGVPVSDPLHGARGWMDLAIHVGFAHPSRNQLCVLRAKVDDQDRVHGEGRSPANRSSTRSLGRATHHLPWSTMISGGLGRLL